MLNAREPMEHELKCWPEYYDAVERGDKPFEIRKWDRPYRVGDTLLLRRYDPSTQDYTGQQMRRKITYLLDLTYLPGDNVPHFASYVALGLDDTRLTTAQRRADKAVEDLTFACGSQPSASDDCSICDICKHKQKDGSCPKQCFMNSLGASNHWQWRGPSAEGEKV